MERLLTKPGRYLIDNGASTFVPLSAYLAENGALPMLREAGYDITFHSVVTGGQGLLDTLQGLDRLAQISTPSSIVVWLNEFFGAIERDGKSFHQMRAYLDNESKIRGTIRVAARNEDTFGRDISEMAARRLTFEEIDQDASFTLMAKQRLRIVRRELYQQLDQFTW
jgi:hypothetical protein